jgi:putative hydroxymethylpyrimidine transport system substrate-binding protein
VRRPIAALAALCAALALAACGEKSERTSPAGGREQVDLVLDYVPNPDHAGIYAALKGGEFREAGLDVKPVVPPDPAAPLKLLATGRADLAISYEPELLLARDRGLDLVAVGALIQTPLTSIMSVGKHAITRVSQLEGKKVGTAGIPYQSAYLKTVLDKAGAGSAKQVDVGFSLVPAMVSKRVDATLGAFWNVEGVQLERRHKKPKIIRIDRAGVPTYNELVIVARADDARHRGPMIRSFLQALAQGHKAVRKDPSVGVDALLAADKNLKRGETAASVRATLPAFFPRSSSRPFGYMDPRAWSRYERWMARRPGGRPPRRRAPTARRRTPCGRGA